MTRNTVVAFSDDQGVSWPCLSCADRGLQLALSKDASLPKSALEEWLSSEAFVDDELDLEQFAAVIRTSVSTARDYCAHGLVPGAYKRQRRKWVIPRASVPRFRERQHQMHGTLKRNGSHVLGRSRRPDTSAWKRVSSL